MPANQSTPEVTRAFLAWNDDDSSKGYCDRERGFHAGYAAALSTTPARGGDELREAADRLLKATDARALHGRDHVPSMREEQEARWVLRSALASTDMAGAGEEVDYAEAARVMFDACRDRFMRAEQCYPAIDALASAGFIAAPPVEGLTSGEGVTPRRLLEDDKPDGYLESDHDFVMNNLDACLAWLEARTTSPKATATASVREAIRAEIVNTPETADFMAGVPLEAAHQRERWGVSHDGGKTPFDWFWLIGYLAQKAANAQLAGDTEKALHHTISTAAALANWHAQIAGRTDMRPGIGPDNGGEKPGSAYALAASLTDSGTAATIGGERA